MRPWVRLRLGDSSVMIYAVATGRGYINAVAFSPAPILPKLGREHLLPLLLRWVSKDSLDLLSLDVNNAVLITREFSSLLGITLSLKKNQS